MSDKKGLFFFFYFLFFIFYNTLTKVTLRTKFLGCVEFENKLTSLSILHILKVLLFYL